jgi:hypothetical protein
VQTGRFATHNEKRPVSYRKRASLFRQRDNYQGDNSYETDMARPLPFRIEAGAAKILIDPFLSDNLSSGQRVERLPRRQELDTGR